MTAMNGFGNVLKYQHFDREIIILCVRSTHKLHLSSRDVVEMMAERVNIIESLMAA